MPKFKFHRLKIVEQIAIVLFFAVLIPLSVSGFIINNINQQAVRAQLRASAVLIANTVSDEIDFYSLNVTERIEQLAFALKYFKNDRQKMSYLKDVLKDFHSCEGFEIAKNNEELKSIKLRNDEKHKATVEAKLNDNRYLVATYDTEELKSQLFRSLKDDKRQIYVLSGDGKLLANHNYKEQDFKETLNLMPKNQVEDEAKIFGDKKNQPLVYIKKSEPNVLIIVNTTEKVVKKTINTNRFKIILSILAAISVIFSVVAIYIFYLYINMRQLFKGIIAITKGNYERQIRLLVTAFTPHEVVFVAGEFNKMASEIQKSYQQLKKNNIELKELNEFRSNLIDTVSHELRTPLTSILGYTSRLMRQDIIIDEETKQKSLRIIKEQSERLEHLIEDLLTIPDIEGMRLKTVSESVWLLEVIEDARLLIRNKNNTEFKYNIDETLPGINADKNRMVQVLTNLFENASKYADEGTSVMVEAFRDKTKAKILIKNKCKMISENKLQSLFGKFIRLDSNTTRTTRGTGLGLFIVKGLVEAMKGEIKLTSTKEWGFCVELTFPFYNNEEEL